MTTPIAKSIVNSAVMKENYRRRFILVKARKHPTASFALVKSGSPMDDYRIRFGIKAVLPRTTQVNGAIGDATTAVITVDSTAGARVGGKYFIPRSGEVGVVASIDSPTQFTAVVTFTGSARGTAAQTGGDAAAIQDNDTIQWMPRAMDEGWTTAPAAQIVYADDYYNEMECWAHGFGITGRARALFERGALRYGQKPQDNKDDALMRLKADFNMSLLDGMRGTSQVTGSGTDGVNTKTGGLRWWSRSVSTSAIDITDRAILENLLLEPSKYCENGELMVTCSPSAFQALNRAYQADTPSNATGNVVEIAGVRIKEITLPWGVKLLPYIDWDFEDVWDNSAGVWRGRLQTWDPSAVTWRPNREIGWYTLPPTGDNESEVVMAEGGWEFGSPYPLVYQHVVRPT